MLMCLRSSPARSRTSFIRSRSDLVGIASRNFSTQASSGFVTLTIAIPFYRTASIRSGSMRAHFGAVDNVARWIVQFSSLIDLIISVVVRGRISRFFRFCQARSKASRCLPSSSGVLSLSLRTNSSAQLSSVSCVLAISPQFYYRTANMRSSAIRAYFAVSPSTVTWLTIRPSASSSSAQAR